MRNLNRLVLPDVLTIVAGIAAGNAITVALAAAIGASEVPAGMGPLGIAASFLVVVVGFTLLPAAVVLGLVTASFRRG